MQKLKEYTAKVRDCQQKLLVMLPSSRSHLRHHLMGVHPHDTACATTCLSKLQSKAEMFVQPRTGHHFRSPQDWGKSYVMVGAGSGLGSVMGLLEEMTS